MRGRNFSRNGAVVMLLSAGGSTRGESYRDVAMVGIAAALIAPAVAIIPGSLFGPF